MKRIINRVAVLLAGGLLVVATGCSGTGDLRTESQAVELGPASAVRLHLEMAAGILKLAGGTNELLKADFAYNVDEWKPRVAYTVSEGNGYLEISQPRNDTGQITSAGARSEWDLGLNSRVPLEIEALMDAGQSNLDLSGMSVSTLDLDLAAGDSTVNLGGPRKVDLKATIRSGAGKTTVILPRDTSARVTVHGGIGTVLTDGLDRQGDAYSNAAYGQPGPGVDVTVESGVGQIVLTTINPDQAIR